MVISITGGVGSGKSRVLQFLKESCRAYIIQADSVAHQLMEPQKPGYISLVETFGGTYLDDDGNFSKEMLSSAIFLDSDVRHRVDSIIHPMVWDAIGEEIKVCKAPLIVVEAALFDPSRFSMFDERWYLHADREIRIGRLMESRGYTRERCLAILASQPSEEEFRANCQFVIDNNGDLEDTKQQIRALLEKEVLCG